MRSGGSYSGGRSTLGAPTVAVVGLLVALGSCKRDAPKRQRVKPAVVVVESDDELGQESLHEIEPNDQPVQAQALPLAETVSGTLRVSHSEADQDWYRLKVRGARILRIESSGAAKLDLVLGLYDKQGKLLIDVNDAGVGGGETLVNAAVDQGEYLVRVSAAIADETAALHERSYRLRASVRLVQPNEEREPNGAADRASRLHWDGEVAGYCGWRRDVDWYAVEVPDSLKGLLLRFELDGVDGVQPRLDIKVGAKTYLQRLARARGAPVVLANVRPPEETSNIFAVVHCGQGYNLDTRYALRVSSVAATGVEQEPNDTADTAQDLLLGESIRGVLADSGDRDVYRPAVPTGSLVRLTVRPPAGLDVALALVDGAGSVQQEVDERRTGGAEMIVPHVWTSGMFVRLRAPRSAATDAVSPYRLSLELLEGQDWEREPNDLPARATLWPGAQQQMRGFLHPATDVDHFRITADSATLRLALVMPGGGPALVELLESQSVVESVALAAGAARVVLETPVSVGGTYVLRVHNSAEQGDLARSYTLERIKIAPLGPAPGDLGPAPGELER